MRRWTKEKKKYLDGRKRYCFICDTEIEKMTLDEKYVTKRVVNVCPNCSKITYGYYEEEKILVKELRDFLGKSDYWMIKYLVIIARKFVKQFVCTAN